MKTIVRMTIEVSIEHPETTTRAALESAFARTTADYIDGLGIPPAFGSVLNIGAVVHAAECVPDIPQTSAEWCEMLVGYGLAAYDRAFEEDPHMSSPDRDIIEKHMRERMAQAASSVVCAIDEARSR